VQDTTQHSKLNTLVTFPVAGLDISRHSRRQNNPASSSQQRDASSKVSSSPWLTWKPGRKVPDSCDDHVYDLYAVCNHYGNMQGGHYTGQLDVIRIFMPPPPWGGGRGIHSFYFAPAICNHKHTQLLNCIWSGTTQVGRYQKKRSPTHIHPGHQTSFINFVYLLRSMASSVFSLRA